MFSHTEEARFSASSEVDTDREAGAALFELGAPLSLYFEAGGGELSFREASAEVVSFGRASAEDGGGDGGGGGGCSCARWSSCLCSGRYPECAQQATMRCARGGGVVSAAYSASAPPCEKPASTIGIGDGAEAEPEAEAPVALPVAAEPEAEVEATAREKDM